MDPSKFKNYDSLTGNLINENVKEKNNEYTNSMFILLNIFYLILSLLILTAGATGQFVYLNYGPKLELNLVPALWMLSGYALLFVSILGIVVARKNSVTWINIYCILLIVAFAVQLLVATVGFNLKSESVKGTLDNLMNEFESIDRSTLTMNFIQKSFQCCGVESPKDWKKHLNYYSNKFYYNDCDGSIKQLLMLRTPQSCCTSGSGYQNLRCNNYFQNGCLGKLSELIGQLILTLKTLAVVLGLFQE